MKEKKLYECEICGTIYAERHKAQSCEELHKTKLKIKDYRFRPYSEDESGFPVTITVVDDEGHTKVYKR